MDLTWDIRIILGNNSRHCNKLTEKPNCLQSKYLSTIKGWLYHFPQDGGGRSGFRGRGIQRGFKKRRFHF